MSMRILILLTTIATGLLPADTLTYTVSSMAGQFEYDFTLTNLGDHGYALWDLFLALPTDIANIDTTAIGTPAGWGDATGGLLFYGPDLNPSTSFIEWSADPSGLYDICLCDSLSGFSFTTMQAIEQPITFALNGSMEFATAVDPPLPSVPEPGSFVSLLIGLASLAGHRRFRSARLRRT